MHVFRQFDLLFLFLCQCHMYVLQVKIRETIELFKTKDVELREFLSAHERNTEENLVDQQIEPKAPLFKQ